MKTSPIEAKLYLSDQHFGEKNPDREGMGNKLSEFLNEYNLKINEIIDNGDGVNCGLLEESFGKTEEEIEAINSKEAEAIRRFYKQILPEGGKVSVRLGNHQSEIVEGEATEEATREAKERSLATLKNYLEAEIKPELPSLEFEVITGIQQVEENVLTEHGMYYDVFSDVRKILNEFDDTMSLEDKLAKLQDSPEIEMKLQELWKKMKKGWPLMKKLGMKDSSTYENFFDFFHMFKDLESGFNRLKKTDVPFSHSHNEHVLKQLELMGKIANSKKLTMISGHRHRKDAQAKDNLLSISLGDWEHSNKTPSCALHVPDGEIDRWVIAEYRREDDSFDLHQKQGEGHWRIVKEFTFNVDENKWEEKFETSLKSVGEESIGNEWSKYEIEGKLKEKRETD